MLGEQLQQQQRQQQQQELKKAKKAKENGNKLCKWTVLSPYAPRKCGAYSIPIKSALEHFDCHEEGYEESYETARAAHEKEIHRLEAVIIRLSAIIANLRLEDPK